MDEDDIIGKEEADVVLMSIDANGTYTTERSSGNFANVVVFVDFKNTSHEGDHRTNGTGSKGTNSGCFMDFDKTKNLFDGSPECPRGLSEYLSHISYGKLKVDNIFPQYDENQNKIMPYVLSGNMEDYDGNDINTDKRIIDEVLEYLRQDEKMSSMNLDRNGDGCVDNLTIVVACRRYNASTFYGRKGNYGAGDSLNGCKVTNYVRLPEYGAYGYLQSYGLVIHEFLHTLGYPDLYTSDSSSLKNPVGHWDVMASTLPGVQYPLAYLRSEYTHWFDIPVTQTSGSYSLYAASATTAETKDRQALIMKTAYSDTEYFVLEFRK